MNEYSKCSLEATHTGCYLKTQIRSLTNSSWI